MEVAQALRRIRDEELYRENYKTFEEYVDKRWGWTRRRAYQLIDACEVREDLCTVVHIPEAAEITRERQLRELADVPTDSLEEVVTTAAKLADGKPITASILRKAKQQVMEPGDEPEAVAELTGPDAALANRPLITKLINMIHAVRRAITDTPDVPGTERLQRSEKSIVLHLDNANSSLKCCVPEQTCDKCGGGGCPLCDSLGWIDGQTVANRKR